MNMNADTRVVVTGAGGFIGHHLCKFLKAKGLWVRGVDTAKTWIRRSDCDEFLQYDLRDYNLALAAFRHVDFGFLLAANMGGIGYISAQHAPIVADNAIISQNSLMAARLNNVSGIFFASSACVYPTFRQRRAEVIDLKESHAIPANPEGGYGWEKLFAELLCQFYHEAGWLTPYIARYHNVFGPEGSWNDERTKAPAAICRKVAEAKRDGIDEVRIWGDGEQTRSFLYIEDCLEGVWQLVQSGHHEPLNIGSDRLITINELVRIVAGIAGIEVRIVHELEKPQGVRGRNSDNTMCRKVLGWSPAISLEVGMEKTYRWVEKLVFDAKGRGS